jgi:hypothetical protein
MTSKIRHSQLDTKSIKEIKVIYNKYDSRASEINRAIWTIKKFGIPMSTVTLQAMKDKAWFYRKQAWEVNAYLYKKIGRTVSEKRKVLIEKCKTKCGATIKGSREVQSLRPAQQGTSLIQRLRQLTTARPTNGVDTSGVQVAQDHQPHIRSEFLGDSDGSSPSAPQSGRAKYFGWLRWFNSIRPGK